MAIHPAFPVSPYEGLKPEHRWFPADEDLRESAHDKLVPPSVSKIRREVETWRENQYERARGRRAAGADRNLLRRSTSGRKKRSAPCGHRCGRYCWSALAAQRWAQWPTSWMMNCKSASAAASLTVTERRRVAGPRVFPAPNAVSTPVDTPRRANASRWPPRTIKFWKVA